MGWIPADAKLTPRPASIPAWSDIPDNQHAFQTRLMEVFAGFCAIPEAVPATGCCLPQEWKT